MSKRKISIIAVLAAIVVLGCAALLAAGLSEGSRAGSAAAEAVAASAASAPVAAQPAVSPSENGSQKPDNNSAEPTQTPAQPTQTPPEPGEAADRRLIVLDAGHQSTGDSSLEPVGPGASELKAKVSSGTVGRYTGLPEYELNLRVALKLQAALEAAGYDVVMVRTANDVNISNSERALLANEAGADAFIRLHANGSEDSSEHGVLTICQTSGNPYNGAMYGACRALSREILGGVVAETGAADRGIWETDTMSGINWCTVPVTILEMGYMTNEREDRLLSTDAYQALIVRGIVAGLASFFGEQQTAPDLTPPAQTPSPAPSAAKEAEGLPGLGEKLAGSLAGLPSQWDVYVERLSDGAVAGCRRNPPEDGRMVAASLIKLFVMGAVYEQVSLGNISEDAAAADLERMITVSDNDATNRLIRLLGGGGSEKGFLCVNRFAESLGCRQTELRRLMLDWDKGLENYTSAGDCARLLRLICTGRCVSAGYSEKMLELLKAQEKNEGLIWPIPENVEVASKPGFISGVSVGDAGIVFGPGGDYIICVICNKPGSDDGARQKIAEISEIAYDYFAGA